eukprot:TRINITY_DN36485_c0_g1_i1.p1 TRINITY_DN36485_c0_g1~~TRINITY_DN36485_c0_g1_i1.p1  ORF type:complete len:706 (+),score=137.45 TRINITY_DN36485_c0_g1_i1:2-2119(+)
MAARMGTNSLAKITQIAKDAESACSYLLANAKIVEGQFKALRAEHESLRAEAEALRRCLDRSGVLPADELDEELRRCGARPAVSRADLRVPVEEEISSEPPPPDAALPPVSNGVGASAAPTSRPAALAASQIPRPKGYPTQSARPDDRDLPLTCRSSSPRLQRSRQAAESSIPSPSLPSPMATNPAVRGRSPGPGKASPTQTTQGLRVPSKRPISRPPAEAMKGSVHGASLSSFGTDQDEGRTADFGDLLQSALGNGGNGHADRAEVMRSLQRSLKANPELQGSYADPDSGGSALNAAVKAGCSDVAKVLLKAQADPNEKDTKGVSALHLATFDGNYELAKVLLMAKANVDSCDRHGQTPLFFAPTKDICKLLIERRSDVSVLNRRGQSALHLAGRAGLHEVLSWLSWRVNQNLVDLKDVHGVAAKTYAKMSGVPLPSPPTITVRSPSPSSKGFKDSKGRRPARPQSPPGPTRSGSARSLNSFEGTSGRISPVASADAFDFFEVADENSPSPPKKSSERQESVGRAPLPSVSELVSDVGLASTRKAPEGATQSYGNLRSYDGQPSLEAMYAGFDNLERLQQLRHSSSPSPGMSHDVAATATASNPVLNLATGTAALSDDPAPALAALAAAAAVATAAVTTAAELTPRAIGRRSGATEEARRRSAELAEIGVFEDEDSAGAMVPEQDNLPLEKMRLQLDEQIDECW